MHIYQYRNITIIKCFSNCLLSLKSYIVRRMMLLEHISSTIFMPEAINIMTKSTVQYIRYFNYWIVDLVFTEYTITFCSKASNAVCGNNKPL